MNTYVTHAMIRIVAKRMATVLKQPAFPYICRWYRSKHENNQVVYTYIAPITEEAK